MEAVAEEALPLDLSRRRADEAEGACKKLVEVDMSASRSEVALARLLARRRQIQQELSQVERQIVQVRLQVITIEQRIARLTRRQRLAARQKTVSRPTTGTAPEHRLISSIP